MAYSHHFRLILLLYGVLVGGAACHSTRAVPQTLSVPPLPRGLPHRLHPITLTGTVYRQEDSTVVVPGLELSFRPQNSDSTTLGWRYVTKEDGSYAVPVLTGQPYRMVWRKDGQHGEKQLLPVDESPSDTTRVHRDFYIPYVENTCCVDSLYAPSLYFDTNSATLRPASLARVQSFLRHFTSPAGYAQFALVVVGHAEPYEVPRNYPEKARYLQELALKRALNTCRYLHAKGIASQRLYVVSRGDQLPKLPNTSPEYRQVNRRVDLRLRYLSGLHAPNPAANYDAFVHRAAQGAANPTTARSRQRVVPARVPQHARK